MDTSSIIDPNITNHILNITSNKEDYSQYDIVHPDRSKQLNEVHKEALELFKKKNNDYGDAFAIYGSVGVIVRLGDKIQRLSSITSKSVHLVEDEKIRDTLIDLHNYAAMAIMLLDENKVLKKE
jgi:hypothetical protein